MTRIAGFGAAEVAAHQAKVHGEAAKMRPAVVVSKYGNVKCVIDGLTFHSQREGTRYIYLKSRELDGDISDLRCQVKYVLIPRQDDADGKCLFRATTYAADFVYVENGQTVVEDSKGFPNDRWAMKKSLMYWVHKILVRET